MRKATFQSGCIAKPVSTIQKLQIISFRNSDAFVHGVVDAFVGFTDPVGEVVGILFNQFLASIGAATVDDNPFEVFECLRYNTVDGLLKAIAVVKVYCYDG